MISIKNVTKSYGNTNVKAVDQLQLDIPSGQIFGFLGPNGAGKTTTIKMITGIIKPDSGDIEVDGISVTKDPLAAKQRIGYVPDSPEPYDRLTGLDYLRFIADVYEVSAAERQERLPELLQTFGMEDAVSQLIQSYSRGMKQKITLIAALLHQPSVWILDEPMVGLDPRAARLLKEAMRAHCDQGHTVFFSTHVLEVAERLCDQLAIIHGGKLIASGTMAQLKQGKGEDVSDEKTLENLFLELTER
ncbi:ABC transporter ATP-binding protein [Numidum massiliense]|uniref:ABC transporter ATP-binding protein n=1 Tax=Numidum massiliense TaxID=1522315 RepID=UPI0006D59CC8|nr:ABC transporter ATP-binding protein [Numidum massiliense]